MNDFVVNDLNDVIVTAEYIIQAVACAKIQGEQCVGCFINPHLSDEQWDFLQQTLGTFGVVDRFEIDYFNVHFFY